MKTINVSTYVSYAFSAFGALIGSVMGSLMYVAPLALAL